VTVSIVLTEQALGAGDAVRIVALHDPPARLRVLVPADTDRSLLVDVLDHLSLLDLRGALEAVRGEEEQEQRAEAGHALDASLRALRAAGADADGLVVRGDPLAAAGDAVRAVDAGENAELVVVTRPHAVEDTFHTDWASRARDRLRVPVLHVYAGSSWVG
jgi:predicted neutral ceramidase superfamily lipid hydrolase